MGREGTRRRRGGVGVVWACVAFAAGVWTFNGGFFLTRTEVEDRGGCGTGASVGEGGGGQVVGACGERHFGRVVVLVVDALRYDFAGLDSGSAGGGEAAHAWVGALGSVREALESAPWAARAVRFVADAPTTTAQRLKGLATGSVPTFGEVAGAFSPARGAEDTVWERAWVDGGLRVGVGGDDTWVAVFGDQMRWARPYPSFNVKDLDTVDEGVLRDVLPEALGVPPMAWAWNGHGEAATAPGAADPGPDPGADAGARAFGRGTWDVVIGHGLGVDHAGHIFGVETPEMGAKVAQMDAAVRWLMDTLDAQEAAADCDVEGEGEARPECRTLLLVLGDHGQTLHGDHGGGSEEEVDTLLFAYAAGGRRRRGDNCEVGGDSCEVGGDSCEGTCGAGRWEERYATRVGGIPRMPQVDFAATLAALLGVGAPFGSLGSPSLELLSLSPLLVARGAERAEKALDDAVERAAWGVRRYLDRYASVKGLPAAVQAAVDAAWADARGAAASGGGRDAHQRFIAVAAGACRAMWAEFNLPLMLAGLGIQAAGAFVLLALVVRGASREWVGPQGAASATWTTRLFPLVGTACGVAHAVSVFGVRFVEGELGLVRVLLGACVAAIAASEGLLAAKSPLRAGGAAQAVALFALLALTSLPADSSAADQGQGVPQQQPRSDKGGHGEALGLAWQEAARAVLLVLAAWSLYRCRALRGGDDLTKVPPGRGEGKLGQRPRLVDIFMDLLADMTAAGGAVAACLLWAHEAGVLGSVSDALERTLRHATLAHVLPRAAYGLSIFACGLSAVRAYSGHAPAHLRGALLGVLPSLCVLSYRRGAPLLLGSVALACALADATTAAASDSASLRVLRRLARGSAWSLCVSFAFLATGHAPRFDALHYGSAFIGFDDFNWYRCGLMLALNTFAPHVALTLAAMAVGPLDGGGIRSASAAAPPPWASPAFLPFLVHRALIAWCAAACACLQNRHLHLWALWAPKYIFEGVATLGVLGVAAMAHLADHAARVGDRPDKDA